MPVSHTMNPLAMGAAKRWQGYVARDGLGMTRTKNHSNDAIPTKGTTQGSQRRLHVTLMERPVFGQTIAMCSGFLLAIFDTSTDPPYFIRLSSPIQGPTGKLPG
jgi:hypothetical protein